MASGSNRFIQYVKQSEPKALPASPVFTRLRTTGGSGLMNNRSNITSNEIRDDRQIIVSRLGQNQPDVMIPFELSYDSFDELIQGAMGGSWVGGRTVVANTGVNTAGVFTLTGVGDVWANYEINVGDYVIINGTTNTNLLGVVGVINEDVLTVYQIGTTSGLVTDTEADTDFTFVTGHYGANLALSVDTTLAVAINGTYTRGGTEPGSWVALGVELGDKVWFNGFAETGNNGWKKVTAVTDTVLTVESETDLVVESLSTGTIKFGTSSGFITVGKDLDFFAFEEGFTDITTGEDIDGEQVTDGIYHNAKGAYVASMSMNIQPDSIITGELSFQALTYSGFKKDSVASSIKQSNINDVFDSFTGDLILPDAPELQGVITGLNYTLDNGLIRRYALMDKDAQSIGDGRSNTTGTLNCYFESAGVANLFEQEREFVIAIRTEDLAGNSYLMGWPRVKLTSDSRDITENDVTQNVNFQALGGLATDKKKTMYILRQPAIA